MVFLRNIYYTDRKEVQEVKIGNIRLCKQRIVNYCPIVCSEPRNPFYLESQFVAVRIVWYRMMISIRFDFPNETIHDPDGIHGKCKIHNENGRSTDKVWVSHDLNDVRNQSNHS